MGFPLIIGSPKEIHIYTNDKNLERFTSTPLFQCGCSALGSIHCIFHINNFQYCSHFVLFTFMNALAKQFQMRRLKCEKCTDDGWTMHAQVMAKADMNLWVR
jgi:hypothetical protein